MAKVALPLVRQSPLNPEEKTCSVLVYWRTSLHIKEYQSFYMQTSELIELPRSQSPNQGLEIVDASADSVLLIHFEPARPFIPSNWRHFHFHGRLRKNLPNSVGDFLPELERKPEKESADVEIAALSTSFHLNLKVFISCAWLQGSGGDQIRI